MVFKSVLDEKVRNRTLPAVPWKSIYHSVTAAIKHILRWGLQVIKEIVTIMIRLVLLFLKEVVAMILCSYIVVLPWICILFYRSFPSPLPAINIVELSLLLASIYTLILISLSGISNKRNVVGGSLFAIKYVSLFAVVCWWMPLGLYHLAKFSPRLVRLICVAGKRVFILIHSEIRLLCMTDAMLGALIGYYYGNALVGGVAGAVCGLVNYKLISIKLLKLVKA